VRAKPDISGQLDRCVPIGEWRNRAYRVRQEILDAWGGLSVKDGYIQRSAVPPSFNRPSQFLDWLQIQDINLIRGTINVAEPRVFFVSLQEKVRGVYTHFQSVIFNS